MVRNANNDADLHLSRTVGEVLELSDEELALLEQEDGRPRDDKKRGKDAKRRDLHFSAQRRLKFAAS